MSVSIPSFDYDACFLPLSSDVALENARQTMTKAEFKEWTVKEKKKGQFNLKLSEYAVMRESKRKHIQSHNREIVVLTDVITEFKNKQLTFTGNVNEIQKQVFDFQRRITDFQKSKDMSEEEIRNVYRDFVKAKKEFDRIPERFIPSLVVEEIQPKSLKKKKKK